MEESNLEKYRELYCLSKEVLCEELSRFSRVDEKASKYLSVLTALLGAYCFFANWLLEDIMPPKRALEWIVCATCGLAFIAILGSWFSVLSVMKPHDVDKMPMNDDMIAFFDNHTLMDVYYALARGNKEALIKT